MSFGRPLRHLRECGSTNSYAREMAASGAPDGTVVTTGHQTAGRGRQGRGWLAPRPDSALAYSAIYRGGKEELPISPLLPLAVAVAVCEAVEELAPVKAQAKWPNDIWIEGRKCAGILIEARPQDGWAVIGIGLNLTIEPEEFPEEFRDRATSVGHGVSPIRAREELNIQLSRWVTADEDSILDAFSARDALRGRRVQWADGAGSAEGINGAGNLMVRDDEGARHSLAAGEVHLAPIRGE